MLISWYAGRVLERGFSFRPGGAVSSLPEHELAAFCAVSSEARSREGPTPIERWPMPMRAIRVLLVVWVAVGLAFPATAQQATPRPSPPPAQQDTLCDAFTKGANGDWVAKKDVMVPGPGGMMQLKAGQAADDDLQQRLDDQCS